jgi:hypothetical protein
MAVGGLAAAALSGTAGAAATASEKAHAQKALVTLSDLPQGWTSTQLPSTAAGGTVSGGSPLARCLGVSSKVIGYNPPKVGSPLFRDQAHSVVVEDTVSVYPSAALARQELAALSSRKAAGCIGAALNAATQGAGSSDRVTVARTAAPKGMVAFTLDQTVTTGSGPAPTSTEVVYFFKGQYGDGLDVETSGAQPPVSLTNHLLAVAKARL